MRHWTPEDVIAAFPGAVVIVAMLAAVALGVLDPRPLPGLASVLTGAIGWAGGHAYGWNQGLKSRRSDDPPSPATQGK